MLELHTPVQAAQWLRENVSGVLSTDSRRIGPGDGFIAWPGAATDGRLHVGGALSNGATACLVESEGVEGFALPDGPLARFQGLKQATGLIAAEYYGHPSRALDVVAVTGTNGKTSISWWLSWALSSLKGQAPVPCGVVGTLGIGRPPAVVSSGLTTPDPLLLQQHLRRFVDDGLRACVMEASSIGIEEHRLAAVMMRVAVFSNFTQDHLDYHGSMQAYWAAKRKLFAWPGLQAAVINLDDPKGAELASELACSTVACWTYSTNGPARLMARAIDHDLGGLSFDVVEGAETHQVYTRHIGAFNVANLLAVIGSLRALGIPLAVAAEACGQLPAVPGRMECIAQDGMPLAVVDYAHTPDALNKALAALRPLTKRREGHLWCVFGCGGDRDPDKRPLMGAAATAGADRVVVTSDNPRSENPELILRQILAGVGSGETVIVEPDRRQAIETALRTADSRDVVLIAGKGHEEYQEAAGVRRPFSDRDHAAAALQARRSANALKELV